MVIVFVVITFVVEVLILVYMSVVDMACSSNKVLRASDVEIVEHPPDPEVVVMYS